MTLNAPKPLALDEQQKIIAKLVQLSLHVPVNNATGNVSHQQ
jgi:hypothetical protein